MPGGCGLVFKHMTVPSFLGLQDIPGGALQKDEIPVKQVGQDPMKRGLWLCDSIGGHRLVR